ncbi:MAG TPA: peptide deformylase [Polyangiaceae bacterium]|nr:peptide deformylase [Polyangiaceae bacterium]
MAIRKIAQMGEPVLRRRAEPIDPRQISSPFIQTLIDDMIETMHDADGAGLAAPQVYESLQLCVIEVDQNPRYPQFEPIPLTVLVNPIVTPLVGAGVGSNQLSEEDSFQMYEGCLSVPGMRGLVSRPRKVRVQALDRDGKSLDFVWESFRAVVVQHETDHLLGTLYVDRADPKTLTFLREYERFVPAAARIRDRGKAVVGK